jgi:hypothetical protein
MFSHLLMPPTAVSLRAGAAEGGGVLGVAVALGVPDGAVLGIFDGAVAGAVEGAALGAAAGAVLGVSDGAVAGALVDCAAAPPVTARSAIRPRSLEIMVAS